VGPDAGRGAPVTYEVRLDLAGVSGLE